MKLFIWDFHGVLEKDNEKSVIEISNRVLERAGYEQRFSDEDNERYYGLKWYQYFARLLPSLSVRQQLSLQAACFKFAEDNLDILASNIKPNDHVHEVLMAVRAAGHDQIVISNSRQKDLLWFLGAVGLLDFFAEEQIVGVNAHEKHGTKAEALRGYLQGRKLDELIVIGDSQDDLVLGKEVRAKTYFYKHPHRSHEPTELADHKINDLRQVLAEV